MPPSSVKMRMSASAAPPARHISTAAQPAASREVGEGEDFVNYSKSHFDMWEKLAAGKKIKGRRVWGDFVTFPRGRLLYDVRARRYVLYADKCVTSSDVRRIKKALGIERKRCEVRVDEHYSCDKCEEEKRKLTEVEENGFCLQEGYRLTGYKGNDENVVIPETLSGKNRKS